VVVNVTVSRDTIDLSLTYGAEKLPTVIAGSLGRTFTTVISEIVARPDASVSELNLVSGPDLARMLKWNSPPATPANELIQDRIWSMALEFPERLAVDAWDGVLTYRQLWEYATGLSAILRRHGVQGEGEMPVPICLEKSVWVPVCMLAVLLAGGVCVPIDPDAHVERVQSIIAETSPSIVLVSPLTAQTVDLGATPCRKVVVSPDLYTSSPHQEEEDTKTMPHMQPESAAFLLFTSGSTGRPKGIILQHDSISTTLREQRARLLLDSASRVLHFASYTFDVSVWEVLTTLTAGACICIPSEAARVNDLPGFIRDSRVNWMMSTPSLFRLFRPEDIPAVRTVSLAGEAIPQDLIDLWAGRVQLFNAYGPAECTVCSTHKIEAHDWIPGTVGRAAGGEAWVADQFSVDRLVPMGAVGELLFQGPVVARGYFQQPDVTEKVFLLRRPPWLPASFSEGRGALYRTGDLVSYNADGTLRYLGRKDSQIKLRGQRIELEGIEFQIRRHLPTDSSAVVDVFQPDNQDAAAFLIAFVQTGSGTGTEDGGVELMRADEPFRTLVHEVQAKLIAAVPNYMVPQLMIPIKRIPISKTGKTNRRILRDAVRVLSRADFERLVQGQEGPKPQPATPAEEAMQHLWATVLSRPPEALGVQDNFFQVGGDSVTAMKLVGLARAQGYALAVSDVFNRPTLAGLAAGLGGASPLSQRLQYISYSLLPSDQRIQTLQTTALENCGVASDELEDIYPCTALQEGLMSLTIKHQGSYVAQYQYELGHDIEPRRMANAWDAVVAANPILRTRIIQASSGRLFQVVLKHGTACHLQISGLEEANRKAREQQIGLGTSLMQCYVATEGDKAQLVLTIHHALYDGWSMTLLLEQLESAYSGRQPKTRSFTGFIDYVGRLHPADCRKFWRAYFEGTDTVVFPATNQERDRHAPVATELQLVEQRRDLPEASSRFTLSATVRLAWALVVAKHTGSDDVVFGATVAGRSAPVDGIEEMTGPTIATVPLRVQIRPSCTVEQCLEEVQKQTIAMIPYEGTGLHNIQAMGSDAATACQFQNLLVVQQQGSFYQPKLLHEVHRSTENIAAINTYPLTLLCNLNGDHVLTQASFDSQVLSAAKVQLLVGQFHNVILQLLGPPSLALVDIALDGEQMLHQLQCWNQHIPTPADTTVDTLIGRHFEGRPDAPAVHAWDGQLSYGELDQLSAQLARDLVQRGVGPEAMVPVYLAKCKWTPVAMLAVLRAGGAFVLLDPAHPLDRLKSISSQLGAGVLLSTTTLSSTAQQLASDVLYLDQRDWDCDKPMAPPLGPGHGPRNRLYVVFTSGTTGTPKGVVIEHGAFLASVFGIQDKLGLGPSTRVLQATAHAFDVAIFDHLAVLLTGGCLCIPRTSQSQADLGGAIRELQADYAMMTPSMAELIRPDDVLPSLRTLALVGEPMTAGLVATWADRVKLINAYGPAECSVNCSILAPVRPQGQGQGQSHHSAANIGFATGSASWVVDKDNHDKLAPMGTAGELLVEGPILARGYLGDDAKTRASFILDPTWVRQLPVPVHGEPRRFYKTGDLVQYQPEDGSLLYLGRKDTQVKIRGQRVELGEVEYRIKAALPGAVGLGVVVDVFTPADEGSAPMLAAFVQLAPEFESVGTLFASPTKSFNSLVETTLARLRETLTSAMLPAVFFPVVHIPLSATGKADRRKLKQAASCLTQADVRWYMLAEKSKRPPASATERLVQSICGRVLGMPVEDIGMNDGFVQLGGHSISAIHFTGHVRSAGWDVKLAHVLAEPTLAGLAAKLRPGTTATVASLSLVAAFSLVSGNGQEDAASDMRRRAADACSVTVDDIEDVYPATALQAGLLALSLKRPGSYQAHIYLKPTADGDMEKLKRAWEATVEAHGILRTSFFQGTDGELYQAVVRNTGVRWCNANTSGDMNGLRVTLGGVLCRATVVQEEGQAAMVVLTLHHALYDGWSLPLLFQDIHSAFLGHTLTSAPSFNGFVAYLRQQDVAEMSDFWTSEMQGLSCTPFPRLPTVQYVPSATSVLEHTLDYHHHSGTEQQFTASTMLRLAWATVIAAYTGGSGDVVFGTTVAGRSALVPGIEAMTGPTIATVPFRVRIDPAQRTHDALETLRTRSAQMMRFEQAGLQQIRKFSPEAGVACQFQSLLVVQWMEAMESPENKKSAGFEIDAASANHDTAFSSYAINITCELSSSSIKFNVAYDPVVTAPEVMKMMLFQMAHATSQIRMMAANNNNYPLVRDVMSISPEGMAALSRWNTIPSPPVDDAGAGAARCVHDMILRHCKNTPDAVAVKAWDGELTYAQLAALSARVAASLRHRWSPKSHDEPIVPLVFDKSMWTVVGILGTLRAGAAFLLLDPDQPAARLRLLCEAVGAEVVLASEGRASLAAAVAPNAVVQVCSGAAVAGEEPTPPLTPSESDSDPSRLLYCVFTSGSTGTPKGVLIEHGSFCASIAGVCRILPFGPTTRVFQFASYAFDVGITDHLVPLMVGGSIYIARPEDVKNNFAACLRESEATYLELVPSVARTLDKEAAARLQVLALSGEAKTAADVERWKGRLVSGYGPAECSAASNVQFPVTAEDHPQALGVATGGAGWVVDPDDVERLVPVGAVGELIIEGPIVGRGYLRDPERTAAAFLSPMQWLQRLRAAGGSGGTKPRVYRTGDFVQLLPDGQLRFVGRKDHQVKVRGQRVELGEVENHLHPLFPRATNIIAEVLKPLGLEDQAFLAAFVDLPGHHGQTNGHVGEAEMMLLPPSDSFLAEVRQAERQLRDSVPASMIPALFLPVSHFKLSTSDKVDRRALRALGNKRTWKDLQAYTNTRGPSRGPETETQQALVLLCAKVLNADPNEISIDDGFLSLGGDSISAMSLVAHGNAQGIRLTVADVLSQSSLEKLAARAQMDRDNIPVLPAVVSRPEETPGVPFALAPIQRMFFDVMPLDLLNHFNQSFFVALTQRVAPDDVQSAVHVLLRRHAMLRCSFQQINGEWMQTILSEPPHAPLFQVSSVPNLTAVEQRVLETQRSLDIKKGLLFSVHLFDIEDQGQCLLLVAHHLVVDHVAWRVILADMEQLLLGKHSPSASLSFQTWCHLQEQYVRERSQLSLSSTSTILGSGDNQRSLPAADFLRYWSLADKGTTNTYADAVSTGFSLTPAATLGFLKDANSAFQTRPVDILQAALIFSFIQAFPDRAPPVVHNEGHGREAWDASIDLSRTVGWFTTIWPTPAVVQPGQSLVEAVRRTKDGRRQMPRNGWEYFAAQLLHPEGAQGLALPLEIVINFAGSFHELEDENTLFQWHETQFTQLDAAAQTPRSELFEVSAVVKKGQLHVRITYHRHIASDRVAKWTTAFHAALEDACHILPSLPKQPTLTDVPLLNIDYRGLDRMLKQVAAVVDVGGSAPVEIEDAYPCTGIQQGMLLSQAKNAAHYVTGTTWEVGAPGGVDRHRFIEAWQQVVQRNPALRTVFLESHTGQGWDQVVLRWAGTPGKVVVLEAHGPSTPPMAEDVGPITPTCPWHLVIRNDKGNGDDDGGLRCDFRVLHALVDGVSVGLIQQQIAAAYDGQRLPSLAAGLRDYSAYVQTLPRGAPTRYWADYLAEAEPCMVPTISRDTGDVELDTGVKYVFRTLPSLVELRVFCEKHNVTVFNLVQLAWALVLKAYTGSAAPCFGYLVSGRNVPVPDVEQIVGPFINMVVCRVDLEDGNKPIAEMTQSIHSDFLQGIDHRHTALVEVFHELGVTGRGLFNTIVSLQTRTEDKGMQDAPSGLFMRPTTGDDPTEVSRPILNPVV
jgi:amino acid adenylation domain-containing protein